MANSPLPYILTGIISLVFGFFGGTLLVLYCRRRAVDKSGPSFSRRMTTEVSRTSRNSAPDLESQINSMSNVLEGFITKDVAIFEVNVDYNDKMLSVIQHSEHQVRIEKYMNDCGEYLPAIVTIPPKEDIEECEEEEQYMTNLEYCNGVKEPQYNIYINNFNEELENVKPILGLCVHEKALKVFELIKRQKKQHHMLMQRSRNGNEPFTTIFVGCAKGVVNVKHNRTGVFRLLIWWSLAKDLPVPE